MQLYLHHFPTPTIGWGIGDAVSIMKPQNHLENPDIFWEQSEGSREGDNCCLVYF